MVASFSCYWKKIIEKKRFATPAGPYEAILNLLANYIIYRNLLNRRVCGNATHEIKENKPS